MTLADMNEERLASILMEGIKTATAPLVRRIGELEVRCKELEAEPRLKYLGLHKELPAGQIVKPGDCITHDGSLFVCRVAHVASPTMDPGSWRLAVKRGRDGRDAR